MPVVRKRIAVSDRTAAGTSFPPAAADAGISIAAAATSRKRPSASLVEPAGEVSVTRPTDSQLPARIPIPVPATTSRAR
jgi:hypothetical protein